MKKLNTNLICPRRLGVSKFYYSNSDHQSYRLWVLLTMYPTTTLDSNNICDISIQEKVYIGIHIMEPIFSIAIRFITEDSGRNLDSRLYPI